MTRSPRVDFACRFFPEIVVASPRTARLAQAAIAIGLGPIALMWRRAGAGCRQGIAGSHPRRTSAVDTRRSSPTRRRPMTGRHRSRLSRDPFQQAQPDHDEQRQGARPDVDLQPRICARRRGDADRGRRHHVSTASGASCTRSIRAPASGCGLRSGDRRARAATRAAATSSIAASRSRRARSTSAPRRAADRDRRRRPARRSGRRTPSRHGPSPTRSPARRASYNGKVVIGNGGAEYGVRGYRHRLRRRDRRAGVALVHRARRSVEAVRGRASIARWRAKTWDPAGKWWKQRRRRHRVGQHRLRSRAQPGLHRHRQRLAWNHGTSAARPAATTCSCARSSRSTPTPANTLWHYQEVARRGLGLHRTQPMMLADLTIDGAQAPGHHACAEERLLLRDRPHHRQVHLGEELRQRELGDRLRRRRHRRSRRRCAAATSAYDDRPARSARTTGIRCRSIRRPGSSTFRRRPCRD